MPAFKSADGFSVDPERFGDLFLGQRNGCPGTRKCLANAAGECLHFGGGHVHTTLHVDDNKKSEVMVTPRVA